MSAPAYTYHLLTLAILLLSHIPFATATYLRLSFSTPSSTQPTPSSPIPLYPWLIPAPPPTNANANTTLFPHRPLPTPYWTRTGTGTAPPPGAPSASNTGYFPWRNGTNATYHSPLLHSSTSWNISASVSSTATVSFPPPPSSTNTSETTAAPSLSSLSVAILPGSPGTRSTQQPVPSQAPTQTGPGEPLFTAGARRGMEMGIAWRWSAGVALVVGVAMT